MSKRLAGPILTAFILGGVGLVLVMNFQNPTAPIKPAEIRDQAEETKSVDSTTGSNLPGFREYPIGDEVERNQMKIAAVWLPSVQMEGEPATAENDVIHLEADIRASEGNRHGFAKDEFVPYLTVNYKIEPAEGGKAIHQGEMIPMVASDGQHYGVSIDMPTSGKYKLTYALQPPSSKGMGRHHDKATGVPPWWKPFEVEFEWEYEGPPQVGVAAQP